MPGGDRRCSASRLHLARSPRQFPCGLWNWVGSRDPARDRRGSTRDSLPRGLARSLRTPAVTLWMAAFRCSVPRWVAFAPCSSALCSLPLILMSASASKEEMPMRQFRVSSFKFQVQVFNCSGTRAKLRPELETGNLKLLSHCRILGLKAEYSRSVRKFTTT